MIMSSMAETWSTCKGVSLFHIIKPLRKSQSRQKFTQKKYKNIKNHKKNVLYRFQIWFPIILLCLIQCTKNDPAWILKKTKKIYKTKNIILKMYCINFVESLNLVPLYHAIRKISFWLM